MKFNLFAVLLIAAFVCAGYGAEIPPPTVPENGDVVRMKPPRMDMTCADHQGECMANCNAVWLIRPANDCESGTTCCVLVR